MDNAKELNKNPFKLENKFNNEKKYISKIINKISKSVDSEEKLYDAFKKLLNNSNDALQCWIRANVLDSLGYTEIALDFKTKAFDLGYVVKAANENNNTDTFTITDLENAFEAGAESVDYDENHGFLRNTNFKKYFDTKYGQIHDVTRDVMPTTSTLNTMVDNNLNSDETLKTIKTENMGTINLEEDIATTLLPKIQKIKAETGMYTVTDLEAEILGNGGTLDMTDKVMAYLVNMGFDFDNEIEIEESIEEACNTPEYDLYFKNKLEEFNVTSPVDLTAEQWTEIDNGWESEAQKNESVTTEYPKLRSVKVEFENGDVINTNMAADLTDEEIYNYYKVGSEFNLGRESDDMQKVKNVIILESFTQQMINNDAFLSWNIFPDSVEKPEVPEFNEHAMKLLINDDLFLKFSHNSLSTGNEESDIKNIYKLYVKDNNEMLNKLKTFESYTMNLIENVNNNDDYANLLLNLLNEFEVLNNEDKKEENLVKFVINKLIDVIKSSIKTEKQAFALYTNDIKEELFNAFKDLSVKDIILKFQQSGFNLDDLNKDKLELNIDTMFNITPSATNLIIYIINNLNIKFNDLLYLENNIASILFIASIAIILQSSFGLIIK